MSYNNINKFFDDFMKSASGKTAVARLARVNSFNKANMTISATALPTNENAVINNIPVATIRNGDYMVYYPPRAGDVVVLLFCDNDITNIKLGEDNKETERMHDITDAICVGGIALVSDELSPLDADGLCLQTLDGKAGIAITKDGNINVFAKHFKVEAERIDLN
ncbi:MAG: Gp138 family membrane-puncturing spike protein [Ezakiella sp.]|nr:Gp138 family membrane-puncturing spike protein [Ezakiella sp.]